MFRRPRGITIRVDIPVLMGVRYERAAFPWQSPHFDAASRSGPATT